MELLSNMNIELLAPAKNKACALSAIRHGADAIYIGANAFGARQNASNNLDDIKQIVDYAEKIIVFWDGQSKGAQSVIRYAKQKGKPCEVVLCSQTKKDGE